MYEENFALSIIFLSVTQGNFIRFKIQHDKLRFYLLIRVSMC